MKTDLVVASRPLRIGFLASVGRHLDAFHADLTETWRDTGHLVFAAAGDAARRMPTDIIAGLTQSPTVANILTPIALAAWARKRRLDVIVTNTATSSALVRLAPTRVPIVYFCHGLHWASNEQGSAVWKALEAVLLRRTAGVIVSNSVDEEWMRERLPSDRLIRFPFGVGVPLENFPRTPTPGLEAGRSFDIAWIGDLTERKRPDLAVDVARKLRDEGVGFKMVIAGTGPLEKLLAEQVRSHRLDGHVTLAGRVPSADLISASHVLLHTAKWEGLARVLLEASAIGRNSYGFDVKGVRDAPSIATVPDGDTSALVALLKHDLECGLPDQTYPDQDQLGSPAHADLLMNAIQRWVYRSHLDH